MLRPIQLEARGDRAAPLVFKQGAHPPYAIRWYGITSLFGHFRNFIASAIASESVDSRDWMRPLGPAELLANALRVLGGTVGAATLAEGLVSPDGTPRPIWIDFVADTGDDRDVSQAVARMVFSEVTVQEDGLERVLPRGDVLLFGGDTAYPVATAEEIYRRVIEPWNEVLHEEGRADGRRRVLLGIPGNHDWYDGLDGFGRLFRKRPAGSVNRTSETGRGAEARKARRARKVGLVLRGLHLDEVGGFFRLLADAGRSISAFFRGTKVARRAHLGLSGYDAVQESSFWALPLAPGLDAWGVDRQLGRLDFRQRSYFTHRHKSLGDAREPRLLFIAPDPAIALGESYDPGARMLAACKLSFEKNRVLYLCGDMHHYERRELGQSKHVIAGGGGAFLHGTVIAPSRATSACAYPNAATSRQLVLQMPLHLMLGRAGYLVHVALALLASIELGAGAFSLFRTSSMLITVGIAVFLTRIAGQNKAPEPLKILGVAIPFAIALGLMPWGLWRIMPHIVTKLERETAVLLVYPFLGALVFGVFLAVVAILGLESQQAFTVLGHPGFKHFVRMRVGPDGKIDAWVVGKDDPLADAGPWLIDRWSWDAERETRDEKPAA